jgi:hypothetical protein
VVFRGRKKRLTDSHTRLANFRNNQVKSKENSALKDIKTEAFYRSYSPSLITNRSKNNIQELFVHSLDKQARLKKLEELKKARYDVLNSEKKWPRKLGAAKKINIEIDEKYMDDEFRQSSEVPGEKQSRGSLTEGPKSEFTGEFTEEAESKEHELIRN